MKRFFWIFAALFICFSVFAEKREFVSKNNTQLGTIEISRDGAVNLVSLTILSVMPNYSNNLMTGVLIEFDTWEEALSFYEKNLSINSYDEFVVALDEIRNNPVVLDIPPQRWSQSGISYTMRLVDYNLLTNHVVKEDNNYDYGEYTPYTANEITSNPSQLADKKVVLTNCKVTGVDPINSEGLIAWLASDGGVVLIMVPGLTENGLKAISTYATNKNKRFNFYGQFVYKTSYNYYVLLEKLEVCN